MNDFHRGGSSRRSDAVEVTVLIALSAGLFDTVPLEQMKKAQDAVHETALDISAEIRGRFDTADKLSDEDREVIIELAHDALADFALDSSGNPPSKSVKPAESPKTS